jgi:FkbM family methyltransferase
VQDQVYAAGSRLLLLAMRPRLLREPLTWIAKVWLRHARVANHLRIARYDAVIDGGAGIGEFAALVRLALPAATLVCVEPHPASAATLRRRGFDVVEAALWREEGEMLLTQPLAAVTSCTVVPGLASGRPAWTVKTVRLDQLPIPGSRVLVKLDLQGAEPYALEGMSALWARCSGLLIEVSYGATGTYELLRATLAERGFAEAATLNELESEFGAIEADKLFVRRSAVG